MNFTTGKLPAPLISLAYLLLAIGIWRIVLLDCLGILFVAVSIFLLFTKSKIEIDTENKKLKKYTVFLFFKIGKWEDIKSVKSVLIKKVKITHNMHLLSQSKTDIRFNYKIIMILANKNIEIITKENYNKIKEIADKLATELNISVIDKTTN